MLRACQGRATRSPSVIAGPFLACLSDRTLRLKPRQRVRFREVGSETEMSALGARRRHSGSGSPNRLAAIARSSLRGRFADAKQTSKVPGQSGVWYLSETGCRIQTWRVRPMEWKQARALLGMARTERSVHHFIGWRDQQALPPFPYPAASDDISMASNSPIA